MVKVHSNFFRQTTTYLRITALFCFVSSVLVVNVVIYTWYIAKQKLHASGRLVYCCSFSLGFVAVIMATYTVVHQYTIPGIGQQLLLLLSFCVPWAGQLLLFCIDIIIIVVCEKSVGMLTPRMDASIPPVATCRSLNDIV